MEFISFVETIRSIRNSVNIKLLFTVFLFIGLRFSFSQQPAYSILGAEALEGVDIYSIVQDKDFNYWIGSDEGLFKHDGYNFELVESEDMRSVSVFNLTCLPNGDVLFNNLNQQVFIVRKGKLELFFEIPDAGNDIFLKWLSEDEIYLSTSKVIYILDQKGKIKRSYVPNRPTYIGEPLKLNEQTIINYLGREEGVLVYQNGKFSIHPAHGLHPDHIPAFIFTSHGSVLYAIDQNDKKLFRINPSSWTFKEIGDLKWDKNNLRIRLYNAQGNLWVANLLNGIYSFSAEDEPSHQTELWFPNYFISHIYEDREGNVLLGTFDHGIIVVPSLKIPDVISDPLTKQVTKLALNGNGSLFIGTKQGAILNYNHDFKTLIDEGPKSIETLVYWPREQLLLTDNKYLDLKAKHPGTKAIELGSLKDFVDADGHLVAALNFGVAELSFNPKTRKFIIKHTAHSGRSYAVAYEASKGIWYASTAQGLLYSRDLKKFHPILYQGEVINVGRLKCLDGKCFAFSRQDGFITIEGNKIVSVQALKIKEKKVIVSRFERYKGRWILASNLGLLALTHDGNLSLFYKPLSSQQSNRLIDFCIVDNTLWLANTRGLQKLDLSLLHQPVSKPILTIRHKKVNGSKIDYGQNVFSYVQRNFSFHFFVPTLRDRESVHYYYRLNGADERWNINTYENNEARYFSLAPGSYELQVKAENNGVFSTVKTYAFRITPPFYKSWWFISLSVVIVLLSFYLYYRRQLNTQRRKAQQVNELNASRLTAIQSQMNPHFIFNSLNSIQDLVLKGDVNNSYTFITKFSNLVRRTLSYSDKDFIEFEQEIKLLELYLSLEKLRFKEELVYQIDTDSVEDILIPPMLIQPFIENALIHGLLHKDGEKKLTIRFYMQGEMLICEVEENGVGRQRAKEIKERQGSQHESFAVNAIKKRFEILMTSFPGELGYSYEDLAQGTRVTLCIPVKFQF